MNTPTIDKMFFNCITQSRFMDWEFADKEELNIYILLQDYSILVIPTDFDYFEDYDGRCYGEYPSDFELYLLKEDVNEIDMKLGKEFKDFYYNKLSEIYYEIKKNKEIKCN